jgi:hypothetical protein
VERKITVANAGDAPLELKLAVELPGLVASVSPAELTVEPGARQTVTLKLEATGSGRPPGYLTGRIRTAAGADPAVASVIGVPIGPPPPARLGPLALSSSKGDTDGVRFTAGALAGGDPAGGGARSVEPLGNLRLQLVDDKGKVVRELTPPGGAADLLPGQYAYTLTKDTRGGLRKGTYKFVARGRGPAGGAEVVRSSPTFRVR